MAKILKESPLRKKRQKVWRARFALCLFLLVGVIVGLSFWSKSPKMAISTVTVTGAKSVDEQQVEKLANQTLDEQYLHLFSKRNFLIYPKAEIKQNILRELTRISEVKINLDKKVLSINIVEREGEFLWCEGMATFDKCYFLDNQSYIFSVAPYFSDGVYFKVYSPLASPYADPIGQSVFKDGYFEKVLEFKKELEVLGLKIVALEYKEDVSKFLLESRGNATNPEIIFNNNA